MLQCMLDRTARRMGNADTIHSAKSGLIGTFLMGKRGRMRGRTGGKNLAYA